MIVGTTLFKMGSSVAYYSPEFPRGGLAATFAVDMINMEGSPTVTFQVEHRNAEDTTFTTVGSANDVTSVGSSSWDVTGLKEIVRIAVVFGAGDQSTDGAHFLLQLPSWRPYP